MTIQQIIQNLKFSYYGIEHDPDWNRARQLNEKERHAYFLSAIDAIEKISILDADGHKKTTAGGE